MDDLTIISEQNPHFSAIQDDITNRTTWADRDLVLQRRRLCDRPKKKTTPYVGAPNFAVPIMDDIVRDLTEMQASMILNAPRVASFIPLEKVDRGDVRKAEIAFDTLLKYIIMFGPVVEQALDCKNARGYAIAKITRANFSRWGEFPTIDFRDPIDCVLPSTARRDMQTSERICDIYRFSKAEFEALVADKKTWKNTDDVLKFCDAKWYGAEGENTIQTLRELIGLKTDGKNVIEIPLFEHYTLCTDWDKRMAMKLYGPAGVRPLEKGHRIKVVFCPLLPNKPIAIQPWSEDGKDRPWPHIQMRSENRSQLFYDTRGAAQLVMDDQLAATATRNAKHVIMDFYQQPQYKGKHRNSTEMDCRPGGFVPDGVERVPPVEISNSFDFTTELFKREAASRVKSQAGSQFSGEMSESRKLQKTAAEVYQQAAMSDVVSTMSVNRFLGPWGEVFMQVWDDLRRLKGKIEIPLISNMEYEGSMDKGILDKKFLIVPAGSAKTLNPDMQFLKDEDLWTFCQDKLASFGVTFDVDRVAADILANVDPSKSRWIIPADKAGPGGKQPVYKALEEIAGTAKKLEEAVVNIGEFIEELAQRLDAMEAKNAGPGIIPPAIPPVQ